MKAFINGRIVLPNGVEEGKALLINDTIVGVCAVEEIPCDAEKIDAKGCYIAPGLVDVHIHGYLGEDASDGSAQGVIKMAQGVAKNGVTSWLPTTMTVSKDDLRKAFEVARELKKESLKDEWTGAEILGVHAEGPFINPGKKGAQAGEHILPPDASFVLEYADILRIVTLAPEMEGGMEFIRQVTENSNVVVSMGHTGADFETAMEAVANGVNHVTHTFNAMTALTHRGPGVVGAALASDAYAELIADTFHIHKGLFPLMVKAKGDKLVLITDCTRAGGLSDGKYDLGGQDIFVKGIECRLADGTIAGSVLKLNEAVRNLALYGGVEVHEAFNMASRNPACSIGETRKGTLEAGKDADVVLMDDEFNVHATYLRGRCIYQA